MLFRFQGIFCGYIGLFDGYAGPFCGFTGLFCGYEARLSVYIGFLCRCARLCCDDWWAEWWGRVDEVLLRILRAL